MDWTALVGAFGAAGGPLVFAVCSAEIGYTVFLALVAATILMGALTPAPQWRKPVP